MDCQNYFKWLQDSKKFYLELEQNISNEDIKFQILFGLYEEALYLRKKEYPSVEDQLDILYHYGYDYWHDLIKSIKSKYPLPEKLEHEISGCGNCYIDAEGNEIPR